MHAVPEDRAQPTPTQNGYEAMSLYLSRVDRVNPARKGDSGEATSPDVAL